MASEIIVYIKTYNISYYSSTQPLPGWEGEGGHLVLCVYIMPPESRGKGGGAENAF